MPFHHYGPDSLFIFPMWSVIALQPIVVRYSGNGANFNRLWIVGVARGLRVGTKAETLGHKSASSVRVSINIE